MLMEKKLDGSWVQASSVEHSCPQCSAALSRVHRRPIDRFFSHFNRLARYECDSHLCRWVGNIRVRNDEVDSSCLSFGRDTRPSKTPRSFVFTIWLSVIGAAIVVLAGTTEIVTGPEVKLEEHSLVMLRSAEKIVIEPPGK